MSSNARYDRIAIAIHWLTAMAIVAQFVLGWTMTSMRPGSSLHASLYQQHKSVGMTILALSILRLVWRLLHRPPPLPAAMPAWEKRAAKLSHGLLYVLLVALPISGWAVVSASPLNIPTLLYGILPLPHLPVLPDLPDKRATEHALKVLHEFGGWILLGLLGAHIGAALRHHFLIRDDVLARMLPRFKPRLSSS